ncbi:MAG: hypothetical protein ACKOU7_02365 [Ferruginibacter sp.]
MKTLEELKTDRSVFSIGQAMSDGWAIVAKHLGFYILGGIITIVIGAGVGIIPIAGGIVNNLILSPCLMAGAVFVTWNISKGRGWTDFGDMFKGFNYLQPMAISTFIQGVASLILVVLVFYNFLPEIVDLFKISQGTDAFTRQDEIKDAAMQLFTGKFIVSCVILTVALLFISCLWAFKNHFIVIYKMQAWPAMEMSRKIARHNLGQIIGLFVLLGIIILISAIPCGIGLLFSLPLMIGSVYSAFAQITGCDQADEINEQMFDFMADEKKEM